MGSELLRHAKQPLIHLIDFVVNKSDLLNILEINGEDNLFNPIKIHVMRKSTFQQQLAQNNDSIIMELVTPFKVQKIHEFRSREEFEEHLIATMLREGGEGRHFSSMRILAFDPKLRDSKIYTVDDLISYPDKEDLLLHKGYQSYMMNPNRLPGATNLMFSKEQQVTSITQQPAIVSRAANLRFKPIFRRQPLF
jgi:hypothetical protein